MDELADFDVMGGCVCVVGSMNADYTVQVEFLPQVGETVNGGAMRILPGGKSGNQAAVAALLGTSVRMFGAVGSDTNADFLLGNLAQVDVDVSHVLQVDGPSGTTLITVDAQGENTIVYSAGSNALVSPAYIEFVKESLTSAPVLGLCMESPLETVVAAAQLCHSSGMKVLLNNSPFVVDLPRELIDASDILLVNKLEAAQLFNEPALNDCQEGLVDWLGLAKTVQLFGFESVVITLGGEGSVVVDGGAVTRIKPVLVDAQDTTGCGDAFMGAILAGLASGFTLVRAAKLASYVAAYAALSEGAQASYGTPAEIRAYFQLERG
ncbi:MAG: ribokinase [Gordonibacter sp.]|nr:ribokinase [Gordonibacter sp.]